MLLLVQFGGDLDAGTGTSGTITFNNAEAGVATEPVLFFNNVTGTSEAEGAGSANITFITVSTSNYHYRSWLIVRTDSNVKWGPSGPLFLYEQSQLGLINWIEMVSLSSRS